MFSSCWIITIFKKKYNCYRWLVIRWFIVLLYSHHTILHVLRYTIVWYYIDYTTHLHHTFLCRCYCCCHLRRCMFRTFQIFSGELSRNTLYTISRYYVYYNIIHYITLHIILCCVLYYTLYHIVLYIILCYVLYYAVLQYVLYYYTIYYIILYNILHHILYIILLSIWSIKDAEAC